MDLPLKNFLFGFKTQIWEADIDFSIAIIHIFIFWSMGIVELLDVWYQTSMNQQNSK